MAFVTPQYFSFLISTRYIPSFNDAGESTTNENTPSMVVNTTPMINQTEEANKSKTGSVDSKKKAAKKPFVERVGDWVCIKCKDELSTDSLLINLIKWLIRN